MRERYLGKKKQAEEMKGWNKREPVCQSNDKCANERIVSEKTSKLKMTLSCTPCRKD